MGEGGEQVQADLLERGISCLSFKMLQFSADPGREGGRSEAEKEAGLSQSPQPAFSLQHQELVTGESVRYLREKDEGNSQ